MRNGALRFHSIHAALSLSLSLFARWSAAVGWSIAHVPVLMAILAILVFTRCIALPFYVMYFRQKSLFCSTSFLECLSHIFLHLLSLTCNNSYFIIFIENMLDVFLIYRHFNFKKIIWANYTRVYYAFKLWHCNF